MNVVWRSMYFKKKLCYFSKTRINEHISTYVFCVSSQKAWLSNTIIIVRWSFRLMLWRHSLLCHYYYMMIVCERERGIPYMWYYIHSLEGNPGKITQGGLLPDHPPSPLFNGDPALHRQCPGRVLSFEALSKHFLDFVLETTQMWASAAIWQNLIMATKKVWHIKPEIREKTSFLSAAVMSVIMT